MGDKNKFYHEVQLQLTADNHPQLRVLKDRIERQLDKAEKLYEVLLKQTSDQSARANYNHQLGYLKRQQDDRKMALKYRGRTLEISEKTFVRITLIWLYFVQHRHGVSQHGRVFESPQLFGTDSGHWTAWSTD
ncbi:unnamed protein product, partial [Adineta ricciae]